MNPAYKYALTSRPDQEGQALVEYALVLTLVALVCAAVLGALGLATQGAFNAVTCGLTEGEAATDCEGLQELADNINNGGGGGNDTTDPADAPCTIQNAGIICLGNGTVQAVVQLTPQTGQACNSSNISFARITVQEGSNSTTATMIYDTLTGYWGTTPINQAGNLVFDALCNANVATTGNTPGTIRITTSINSFGTYDNNGTISILGS